LEAGGRTKASSSHRHAGPKGATCKRTARPFDHGGIDGIPERRARDREERSPRRAGRRSRGPAFLFVHPSPGLCSCPLVSTSRPAARYTKQCPSVGEENTKSKPAEEVEMKEAMVRGVIVTAFALATATLRIASCPSPAGGTPERAVPAAGISRNTSGVTVPSYWKNAIWTGLTPLDSTKDSVVYSLCPLQPKLRSATYVVGGEISCPSPKEQ
jgi:hypothetical protein